ncbi:MAG: Outer membrane adhesin like protein [Candidatus Amesbacteria bacterium GW2011_GWA1_47_16]|uniref:Outer membrane adhesin like protein n=4 Tax=Candidatus Amesiibacteriota TaxID=1752730 RepID=A0A0G1S328_9BACT|nr:MAG: Outer membrane adhesin like protein [Candidatus Amesbacteria bacterium GW2011_GWA1_47_16]KKU63782.1 MAG: Outer membrane adhesin like protein [Candidatus Amesbacteria bacterium GW2011_GWC1_47_15]KKU97585.1 MAG: Outer membrane adhesin like protein [Candidatus Amesbacteria bacterium GW2011_GWB1_48_13]OGC98727.1 MAG: hypothetical protein A2701_01405 [Candidatus Amesbacteria bacterium RIFCSPHIGHO2_01_FULL_47_34]OGC99779.1 MAG: hypothetical protein A2972_01480 [Candidatus Amesbacteria bacteri
MGAKLWNLTKSVLLVFVFTGVVFMSASSPVNAESTVGVLPHATDFLSLPACGNNCGTTYLPTATASQRSTYISQLKSRGYTHVYLSVTASSFNFYSNASGFNSLLTELNNAGIKAVIWLTSDTGTWKDKTVSAIKTDLSNFIPQIDAKVNSYVVGLEANEYWTSTEIQDIGNHMDSLTSKALAAHQTPGKWDYCFQGWCDYMVLQTNSPTQSSTTTQVNQKVLDARAALGKPVVVGEYHKPDESTSITLGNAGLEACAAGFGNGGTVSKIIWPNGVGCGTGPTSTPTPTGLTNKAPSVSNGIYTTTMGKPVDVIFTYDDPDGPGPYTFSITTQPLHGTVTGAATDNDWVYTPAAGYTGTDLFKWRVNDGKTYSLAATINITINTGPTPTKTPTKTPTPATAKPGDANGDNLVNGLDYLIWLSHYGQTAIGAVNGDFNNDSAVNGLDYLIWLNNYGT